MAFLHYKIRIKEALALFVGACITTEQKNKDAKLILSYV